jgi:hypothetical protein
MLAPFATAALQATITTIDLREFSMGEDGKMSPDVLVWGTAIGLINDLT